MCVAGARRAQLELEKHKDTDLRVLVVWFEMYEGDDRATWRAALLNDPRAVHYWDESKAVGRWFAGRGGAFRKSGPVFWDAWLLYETGARAKKNLDKPLAWGRTIVATEKGLAEALERLAAPGNR